MAILAQLIDDVVVHKFELPKPKMVMGRKPENDIAIDDSAVSSRHAQIVQLENSYFDQYIEHYIEDLGSTNGTFLNEQPVVGRQRLHHGDVIRLAWNKFKFFDESEEEMERTVHMVMTKGAQ